MRKNCLFILTIFILVFISCNENHPAKEPVIVLTPEKMNDMVSKNIAEVIAFAASHDGKINESSSLNTFNVVKDFYQSGNYKNIWSDREQESLLSDSLVRFIDSAKYYGLFPADYHQSEIAALRYQFQTDTLAVRDAAAWTRFDLLCTDAFFMLLKDLKEGRMIDDSLSILHKKNLIDSFFIKDLDNAVKSNSLTAIMESAEPTMIQYKNLKDALREFVKNMDTTSYVKIHFPYSDSIKFVRDVYQRLLQEGLADSSIVLPDSLAFSTALKKYQKKNGLEPDGKIGPNTVNSLNENDKEKFLRVAITLDRYKTMESLPETYVWVNIPAFHLQLWDSDTVIMSSKVIVGKPETPTPELSSQINNLVIFPTWTIPASIIKKDILPQLKKDPGYLARKGYNLFTESGIMVDPYTVDWSKYKTGIPWKVVQGSGDDNALGIFKFNFNNPYSVYLHDTNQRYLFANSNRALSHGCVRVQKWMQLADFIADRDSTLLKTGTLNYSKDSIKTWVNNQSRKSIMVKNRLPLYIEYFTCEGKDNKIGFYNDIYNYDKALASKYFRGK